MNWDDIMYGVNQFAPVMGEVLLLPLLVVLVIWWKQLKERNHHITIVLVIVVVMIVDVVLIARYATNHKYVRKYEEGLTYEKDGQYIKAYETYSSIDDYNEAVDGMNRIYLPYRYQLAGQMRNNGQLLDAVVTYAQIAEYRNSEKLMRDTMEQYLKKRSKEEE